MSSVRATRSSVLGKRSHPSTLPCDHTVTNTPLTPERSPDSKRPRVSTTCLDGDSNKENVPPFRLLSPSDVSPTTPRINRSLRRTSTELVTPFTPPPTPPSLLPVHVRTRALLRPLSNSAATIAGREQERDQITSFFHSFLQNETPAADDARILYISGSPGTGKTALVNSILRGRELESTSTRIISVNCMALQGIDALWDKLVEDLDSAKKRATTSKTKKLRGRKAVELLLSHLSKKCILILDELDHVAASFQSLVSVFSLPESNPSCLRVIGIANTHTLTSSTSQFSNHGINGVNTVHFSPYTPPQLLAILQGRLAPLYENQEDGVADRAKKLLPSPTLTLVTKKIAAQSGDVRSLFEVVRGAIDIAVSSLLSSDTDPICASAPVVTPSHILSALKAYAPATTKTSRASVSSSGASLAKTTCNSETVTKVRNLGFQARLALLCLLLASKRLEVGLTLSSSSSSSTVLKSPIKRTQSVKNASTSPASVGIDIAQFHAYYSGVLNKTENDIFTPVSRSELGDLVGILETVGLVTLPSSPPARSISPSKSSRRAFGRTTSFGGVGGQDRRQDVRMAESVRCEEVLRGLGIEGEVKNEAGNDIREEEVRAIWEREKAALIKDVKTNTRAGAGLELDDLFDDATED